MKRYALPRAIAATAIVATLAGPPTCAVEFRSFDGSGNNRSNVVQGAADERIIRFGYDADYPGRIGDLITQIGKPNPRDVSNAVNAQASSILNNRGLSDWVVQWGQFLTHDMTLIENDEAYNELSTGETGDFSIAVNDPGDLLGPTPIPFNRSEYDPNTGNGDMMETPRGPVPIPRWQINAITSYIDASNVYGSDKATARSLRTLVDGKLATSAGGLLPTVDGDGNFVAGDVRANENVGLTSTHTLFVREHNRLAGLIKARDGTLTDEEIFLWTRKIVSAEMQAITYREFLPALMGENAPNAAEYVYDEDVNASITAAFSTAAFRFGHSMQSPRLALVSNAGADVGAIPLATATENPELLTSDPATVELILKGLATQVAQENDAYMIDELRNIPFGPPGAGGTDLAAVDIQRGRDHGLLNNYGQFRTTYDLPPLFGFEEMTSDTSLQAALASVYRTIDEVDGWVGMISEDHVEGSSLGEFAQAILISQFERLRDGDRFFFTGDPDLQSELVRAVIDLESITLGQIIKFNTAITNLQDDAFFAFVVPEPSTWTPLFIGASIALLRRRAPRSDARLAADSVADSRSRDAAPAIVFDRCDAIN